MIRHHSVDQESESNGGRVRDRVRTVTRETFQALVLDGTGPVAVEFMSYGCGFCRALEPSLQQAAETLGAGELIFRVNVGVESELAEAYAIQGTPTILLFRDGQEVARITGPPPSPGGLVDAPPTAIRIGQQEERVSRPRPLLLYNDECGVCRRIASWVASSVGRKEGEVTLDVRPIGDDPDALRLLDPNLDIWDAYATIHLLMPDGSTKLGGEAVAEVLRRVPSTRWLARSFAISVAGWRPFQTAVNVAYTILADVRPLLGCESCGLPSPWVRPLVAAFTWVRGLFGTRGVAGPGRHFAPLTRARSPLLAT